MPEIEEDPVPQETPSSRDELFEALASLEHWRWADWQAYLHAKCHHVPDMMDHELDPGCLIIPAESVAHWERQIGTPYAGLSERERDSDREQVMRYWPLLVEFVARWIDEHEDLDNPSDERSALWQAAMTIEDDEWRRSGGE